MDAARRLLSLLHHFGGGHVGPAGPTNLADEGIQDLLPIPQLPFLIFLGPTFALFFFFSNKYRSIPGSIFHGVFL